MTRLLAEALTGKDKKERKSAPVSAEISFTELGEALSVRGNKSRLTIAMRKAKELKNGANSFLLRSLKELGETSQTESISFDGVELRIPGLEKLQQDGAALHKIMAEKMIIGELNENRMPVDRPDWEGLRIWFTRQIPSGEESSAFYEIKPLRGRKNIAAGDLRSTLTLVF